MLARVMSGDFRERETCLVEVPPVEVKGQCSLVLLLSAPSFGVVQYLMWIYPDGVEYVDIRFRKSGASK